MKSLLNKVWDFITEYYPQLIFILITISIVALTLTIFKYNYNLMLVNDYTSSLYLLSAIVQSLAAILAIVLTLTLVSMQLAAQFLSYRIIKIFILQPAAILIYLVFGFSITFACVLLTKSNQLNFDSNILQINLASLLFFGCIFYLIPYFIFLIRLLEPIRMTDVFLKRVDRKHIIEYLEVIDYGKGLKDFVEIPKLTYNEDPLQPVFEILDLSLQKRTPDTIRGIIMSFRTRILQLLRQRSNEEEALRLTIYFCKNIRKIKEKIFRELKDENIIIEIMDSLNEILEYHTLNILPKCANYALSSIRDISLSVVEDSKFVDAVSFSTPWELIGTLLKSPSNKKLLRVKAKIIRLLAELEEITTGNFLAAEVFSTHESEIAKKKREKEKAKYYKLKFEKQLVIMKKKAKRQKIFEY